MDVVCDDEPHAEITNAARSRRNAEEVRTIMNVLQVRRRIYNELNDIFVE